VLKLRFVRFLVLAWFAVGCFGRGSEFALEDNPPDPSQGLGVCERDDDCVPTGVTCCACPTFATNVGDPKTRVCDDVECPPNMCPDNVEARCNLAVRTCELVCKPLACEITCERGYATDPSGCLSCACAPAPSSADGCQRDDECIQTRADCCGCESGGDDTAVPATDQDRFDGALGCETTPQCPGVNTCDASKQPRCVQGRCDLLAELPAGACGRPDLPACGAGQVCTVNTNDQANLYGLGVCMPR
jgi:hypothetical protein